jgi:hypothetical protein
MRSLVNQAQININANNANFDDVSFDGAIAA